MFELGMTQKEILSGQFNPVNLMSNPVKMVDTDICGKRPSRGSGCIGLNENMLF